MVKRQKEKQYQSAQEHRANSQIRAGGGSISGGTVRKLPFHCCALSLMPFTTPVCTENGIVFEKTAIEPFLEEHKIDPVTGAAMTKSDLIVLHMDKNEEGRWQCPVMTKPFSDHAKIVGIKQPGGKEANVYSYEAYHELNVKAKNYECLVSGAKFDKKKDVIILNSDPSDQEFHRRRDINSFFHVKNQRQLEKKAPQNNNIRYSVTATRILDKIKKNDDTTKKRPTTGKDDQDFQKEGKRLKIFADDVSGVKLTTGKTATSLTSTVVEAASENEAREATEEEIRKSMFQVLRQKKKKGYVRIQTNLGDLLVEIHCDIVPRTATNFIKLCEAKKYNGSSFHRLIKNFMIQGGKPPRDSSDQEESIWGDAFSDEFDNRLKHDAPGILSMANAGPMTNRRQFFITFKNCEYLDRKHSVFGVVIQGLDVLKSMEKVATDKKDRPVHDITIVDTEVVDDPVTEAEEAEMKRFEAKAKARNGEIKKHGKPNSSPVEKSPAETKGSIGRYLPKTAKQTEDSKRTLNDDDARDSTSIDSLHPNKIAKAISASVPKKTKFGNFSGW